MFLSDYVKKRNIILDLKGNDKNSIIKEMAQVLMDSGDVTDKESFVDGIMKREEIESTAIGKGIAIPHTRGEFCDHLSIALGRTKEGIDFKALDGKPVYFILMITAPITVQKEYLQVIAKVARFLKSEDNKKRILEAKTKEELFQVIKDFDARFPGAESVKTKDGRVVHKEM